MKAWFIFVLWTLTIVFLSLYPFKTSDSTRLWEHSDKLVHALMYLVFAVLLMNAQKGKLNYIIALIISVLFGIIIEAFQEFMHLGRHFSIADMIANILGAIIGLTGYFFMKKHRSQVV